MEILQEVQWVSMATKIIITEDRTPTRKASPVKLQ